MNLKIDKLEGKFSFVAADENNTKEKAYFIIMNGNKKYTTINKKLFGKEIDRHAAERVATKLCELLNEISSV